MSGDEVAAPFAPESAPLRGRTIAILENRAGEQFARVLERHGARVLHAPALAELPDVDERALADLLQRWLQRPPSAFVFQTGVGVRALFEATDRLGASESLLQALERASVIVRGPKPQGPLRSRGVRIDHAADEPYTTHEVIVALDRAGLALDDREVVVQRYGESNAGLNAELAHRGARVTELQTYRWSLPADLAPLRELIRHLSEGTLDAVAFTTGAQVTNLFDLARREGGEDALRDSLRSTRVASIGPVCSAALRRHGVDVHVEAHPPKLGPLVTALTAALR